MLYVKITKNMITSRRYLAHEEDGVEDDEQHDEILEGWRGDKPPDVESNPGLALRHIHLQGLRLDHVGDA